jgi:RNA polymerase sigma-70 factor (ECF subfamily)
MAKKQGRDEELLKFFIAAATAAITAAPEKRRRVSRPKPAPKLATSVVPAAQQPAPLAPPASAPSAKITAEDRSYLLNHALRWARSTPAAEDLVQSALLRAYQNIDKFEGGARVRTWVYKIMYHLFCDEIRRNKHRNLGDGFKEERVLPSEVSTLGGLAPLRTGFDPEQEFVRARLREAIDEEIGELSEEHRQVFLLREREEYSYEEIAEKVGIPVGTVMSRLHHARTNLRRALKKH